MERKKAARAPLTVRTYGCVFQSEVDSGHWSSDLRCIQQEAENSVESETFSNIKCKSIGKKEVLTSFARTIVFCKFSDD